MKTIDAKKEKLEQEILCEEFRYWDAQRNGCTEIILTSIREKIKNLKAEINMIQVIKLNKIGMLGELELAELLREAIKLAERKDESFRYKLFQLEGVYIEAKYTLTDNTKRGIRAFNNPDILEPYLQEMNISDFQE
jgi:hypothetical protein